MRGHTLAIVIALAVWCPRGASAQAGLADSGRGTDERGALRLGSV
jgi:hypothetical protein